jgi:hypothetical protein
VDLVKGCPDPATKGGRPSPTTGRAAPSTEARVASVRGGHNREGGVPTGDRAVALGEWMPAAAARREEGTLTGGEAWPR